MTSPRWKLLKGDCRARLAGLDPRSVSLVFTSPPYAMQRANQYGGVSEDDYPQWTAEWMDALGPALKAGASVLINIREHVQNGGISAYVHKTRLAVREAGWREIDELIWAKPSSPPIGNPRYPRRAWERVLWFSQSGRPYCNAKSEGNGSVSKSMGIEPLDPHSGTYLRQASGRSVGLARCTDVVHAKIRNAAEGTSWHPAAFSTDLAKKIIAMFSKPGDLVCDPFAGSATAGIACLELGRRFVGCEMHPEYFAKAADRLRNWRPS